MKYILMSLLFTLHLLLSESFVNILYNKNIIKPKIFFNKMSNHYFSDFTKSISIENKYMIIQSLINYIILQKNDLLYDYCSKNMGYNDIMHIIVSSDLEYIIKKHYYNKTVTELYDIIENNAKLTDCYIRIHTLNNTKLNLSLK